MNGSELEFLYKAIGRGTQCLSALKPGTKIEILGPLGGNPYQLPAESLIPILIAGGTGIASLRFLAQKLTKPGILLFGARNKNELAGLDMFKKKKWDIRIATDDGSIGHKGFVTDLLSKCLYGTGHSPYVLYTCGPHAMIKKVAVMARAHAIEGYASLEEMMGCGVGNCQGCAVKIKDGYKMVCTDGPVFSLDNIE